MGDDLSGDELAELIATLEGGVAKTATGFRSSALLVGALFGVMGAFYLARDAYGVGALVIAFGAAIVALGALASKRTSPTRMQPVVDAIRDAPGDVTWIRYYTTSDTLRLFVRHWLEIKTKSARFVMQAPRWERMLALLRRRCPGATFVE